MLAGCLLVAACTGGAADSAPTAATPATTEPTPSTGSTGSTGSTDPTDPTSGAPAPTSSSEPDQTPVVPPALLDLGQAELDRRLIDAAWDNDLARARDLIRAGADVNAKDETVQSAYLIATSEGYLELLELTLRRGADVDSLDSYDGTGMIRAADRGHHDIVGRLVQAGVRVDHVNNLGWTALHEAIILGDGSQRYVDTVRVLVAAGADVRLPSVRDGVTPLQHAEANGFATIAETLRRALVGRRFTNADVALVRAAAAGDADRAALALRAGADLERRAAQGFTPLALARSRGHAAVVRLLVDLGADPSSADE